MAHTTETPAAPVEAPTYDREWLAKHLAEERHESDLLSEIRELIFGAQDGLVSTLAVVSTVGGASLTIASENASRFPILVAGIASGLAGIFSMAAGEYIGSKSQREIFDAQIVGEREEVHERPDEAQAEMAYMLEEDGLPPEEATRVAAILARHPEVLLRTMVEKELGLNVHHPGGSPLRGAIIMGAAFGAGAAVPILPYVVLPVQPAAYVSVIATGLTVFALGAIKSRWTKRNPITSGLEILVLAAIAGIAGYFFGSVLPGLLGAPASV